MTHQIRIEGTDVSFTCRTDENLIDAAARQGIALPYSCRKGVCENCRGHVVCGELATGTSIPPGHERLSAGEHLLCTVRPASDLCIRPRSWERVDPQARKSLPAKVFRITRVTPDVTVLQLRFPAGVRAKFRAGQYLEVILPDGRRRAYSMANAPHESDGVQIHVRHVPGGAFSSSIVPRLQPGDVLQVELPHGDFWLREGLGRPLLLVAGGTGFAPMRAIVEHLIRQRIALSVHLIWGMRMPSVHYAKDLIDRWREQLLQFTYQPILSQSQTPVDRENRRGSLTTAVLSCGLDVAAHDVYACGAPAMIAELRAACCDGRGLSQDSFHSDAFVPSDTVPS